MKTYLSALGVGTFVRKLLGIRLGRLHQYEPQPLSVKSLIQSSDFGVLPTISLVTPSFNQAQFINKTIESVVSQQYPNLQYIVQDAESSDGTNEILNSYKAEGVRVYIEPDTGQADALNRGFAKTTGDIMGYLNSDDIHLPGTLHLVGRYFNNNPEVDVIYGNRLIINESGLEVGRWILPGHSAHVLRLKDYIPQESMFWRRRMWDKVGAQFNTKLDFALDWDLILRFLTAEAVFAHVSDLFGVFRIHAAQKSQANYVANGADEIDCLRKQYRDSQFNGVSECLLHLNYLRKHRRTDKKYIGLLAGISS